MNFRSFAWLLHRVASWNVIYGRVEPRYVPATARRHCAHTLGLIEYQVRRVLSARPDARWYP